MQAAPINRLSFMNGSYIQLNYRRVLLQHLQEYINLLFILRMWYPTTLQRKNNLTQLAKSLLMSAAKEVGQIMDGERERKKLDSISLSASTVE